MRKVARNQKLLATLYKLPGWAHDLVNFLTGWRIVQVIDDKENTVTYVVTNYYPL